MYLDVLYGYGLPYHVFVGCLNMHTSRAVGVGRDGGYNGAIAHEPKFQQKDPHQFASQILRLAAPYTAQNGWWLR